MVPRIRHTARPVMAEPAVMVGRDSAENDRSGLSGRRAAPGF